MEISVLQWNCMYTEDVGKVTAFIKQLGPDIVCLQELTEHYQDRGDTARFIADQLGYHSHYTYGAMVFPDGSQGYMGNGIFSRYPLSHLKTIQIGKRQTDNSGRVTSDDRHYLSAYVALPNGRRIGVGTTHLPFHPRMRTTPLKRQMIKTILDNIPPTQDFILCGDMNTTPNTDASRTLRQSGLRNAGPGLTHPTWTTKPFNIGPWSYDKLRWRFDYILYQSPAETLRRQSSKIVATDLSDHLPILATFQN